MLLSTLTSLHTLPTHSSICSTGQLLPRAPWPPWCGIHISQYSPGRLPVSSPSGPCRQPSTVVDPRIQSSKHSSHPNQALHPKPTLHPKSSCWERPLTLSLQQRPGHPRPLASPSTPFLTDSYCMPGLQLTWPHQAQSASSLQYMGPRSHGCLPWLPACSPHPPQSS